MLLEHGADPLIPTANGTTPLMMAAGVGHDPGITRSAEHEAFEAVYLLAELGGDVNAVNEAGDTALHGAAWRERADSVVQFLVDRGADVDAKNHRGWTPLVIAEGIHTGGNFIKSDTTAALLRKLGAEPSPPDISRALGSLGLPLPHKCFAGLQKAPSLACQHAGCALWRGFERLRGPPVTAPGARLRPDRAMIFVFATSETGTRYLHARYKSSREMWGKGSARASAP